MFGNFFNRFFFMIIYAKVFDMPLSVVFYRISLFFTILHAFLTFTVCDAGFKKAYQSHAQTARTVLEYKT